MFSGPSNFGRAGFFLDKVKASPAKAGDAAVYA